jgi:hypothetical protein
MNIFLSQFKKQGIFWGENPQESFTIKGRAKIYLTQPQDIDILKTKLSGGA